MPVTPFLCGTAGMLAVSLEARWEVGRQVYGDEELLELELSEHPHGPAAGRRTRSSRNVG